jgi:hypothetical protein
LTGSGCGAHEDMTCYCDVVMPAEPCPPGRTPAKALAQLYETWCSIEPSGKLDPNIRTLFEASRKAAA